MTISDFGLAPHSCLTALVQVAPRLQGRWFPVISRCDRIVGMSNGVALFGVTVHENKLVTWMQSCANREPAYYPVPIAAGHCRILNILQSRFVRAAATIAHVEPAWCAAKHSELLKHILRLIRLSRRATLRENDGSQTLVAEMPGGATIVAKLEDDNNIDSTITQQNFDRNFVGLVGMILHNS